MAGGNWLEKYNMPRATNAVTNKADRHAKPQSIRNGNNSIPSNPRLIRPLPEVLPLDVRFTAPRFFAGAAFARLGAFKGGRFWVITARLIVLEQFNLFRFPCQAEVRASADSHFA